MMGNFSNISKNLPNVHCIALERFVFLESVANIFLPKYNDFGNFVWSLETTLKMEKRQLCKMHPRAFLGISSYLKLQQQ